MVGVVVAGVGLVLVMFGVITLYAGAKGMNVLTLVKGELSKSPPKVPSGWPGVTDAVEALAGFEAIKGASNLLQGLLPQSGGGGGGGNEGSSPEETPSETPTPEETPTPDIPIE